MGKMLRKALSSIPGIALCLAGMLSRRQTAGCAASPSVLLVCLHGDKLPDVLTVGLSPSSCEGFSPASRIIMLSVLPQRERTGRYIFPRNGEQ
jgi:hypothetical protein